MAYSVSVRTVQEVLQSVTRQFGDESGVQLETADIIRWVNDAADEINRRNKVLKATSTSSSVVDQQDYTFPSDNILQIESLHYAGSRLPNMPFPQAEEQIINAQATLNDSGTPYLWYEWGGRFSLWPKPSTVETITLYYTQRPDPVTVVGDVIPLPDKYFQAIVQYVLQQAYEMDEDWTASQAKAQQLDASIGEMAEEERTAQNMTYSIITVLDLFD